MGAHGLPRGRRIFATLASESQGYGNLMLAPEQQAAFVSEEPEVFLPIPGGSGRWAATHIRLAAANEELEDRARLRTAWKLIERTEKRAGRSERAAGPARGLPWIRAFCLCCFRWAR